MTKTDIANIVILREQGKTYQEIGDMYNVSKQAISQIVNKFEMSMGKVRKSNVDIEKICYQGIYDYFKSHPELTFAKFSRLILLTGGAKSQRRLQNFLQGANSSLTINKINKIIELVGKPYEEVFKLRSDIQCN